MRVAIVSGVLDSRLGGPAAVVRAHMTALEGRCDVELHGVVEDDRRSLIQRELPSAHLYNRAFPARWFRGSGLSEALIAAAKRVDLLHAHMLWDHCVYAAWKASHLAGKPLVISPHGSLSEPRRYRSIHKQVYRKLVLSRVLKSAPTVHALNEHEASCARAFGFGGQVVVVPNGLAREEFESEQQWDAAYTEWPWLAHKRIALYVGRVWSGKGLDLLPAAWASASKLGGLADWLLVIAGPDYRGYEASLKRSLKRHQVSESIKLVGATYGDLKRSLMACADFMIMPSHGEGFSVSILEAMSKGLPVLYTDKCHFPELASVGGGWEVLDSLAGITQGLVVATHTPKKQLREMGRTGRDLGLRGHTLEVVGARLVSLYAGALSGYSR